MIDFFSTGTPTGTSNGLPFSSSATSTDTSGAGGLSGGYTPSDDLQRAEIMLSSAHSWASSGSGGGGGGGSGSGSDSGSGSGSGSDGGSGSGSGSGSGGDSGSGSGLGGESSGSGNPYSAAPGTGSVAHSESPSGGGTTANAEAGTSSGTSSGWILWGSTYVSPWHPNAGGIGATVRAYAKSASVAAMGTATGAFSGGVFGGTVGISIGSVAGPGAAAVGSAGASAGGVTGAVAGPIASISAKDVEDAARKAVWPGVSSGILGGGGAALTKTAQMGQTAAVKAVDELARKFLGPEYRAIVNKAGDVVLLSKDGLRKIRFCLIKTSGDKPHVHIEVFSKGAWRDAIKGTHRIYPSGRDPYGPF